MRTVIVDIETGPIADADLEQFMPKEWPTGNAKDPAKVAAIIEEKRAEWKDKAALDALTGQVLAIGTLEKGHIRIFAEDEEGETLASFMVWMIDSDYDITQIVGFCCKSFDLPFIFRRGLKHDIQVMEYWTTKRPWDHRVIDLREIWQAGDRQAHGSLDSVCRHLGIGGKLEGMHGKDFAWVFAEDRAKALAYLENDLRMTEKLAKKLGVKL